MLHQCAPGSQPNLAGAEPGILDSCCDLGWIETSLPLGADNSLPLFEVDFDMTDAIQAPQGLLGPVGSQRSRHAVDAQMSLFDLGEARTGADSPGESRCRKNGPKLSSHSHDLLPFGGISL